jgi:hypothetical protein
VQGTWGKLRESIQPRIRMLVGCGANRGIGKGLGNKKIRLKMIGTTMIKIKRGIQ